MGFDPISAIIGVSSLLGVANQAVSLFRGGGKKSAPAPRKPKAPKPIVDMESFKRPGHMEAPAFLNFGGVTDPLQQRSQIATGAISGDSGIYTDPATQDYYTNLALRSLVDESGQASGSPLPIEWQYLEQGLGKKPLSNSPQSFLSALLR